MERDEAEMRIFPEGHPKAESLKGAVGLDLDQLNRRGAVVAVIELATQPPYVLQQVTLRPDKVSRSGLIRLGETPGDEAVCWIDPKAVYVHEILGTAVEDAEGWHVKPMERAA